MQSGMAFREILRKIVCWCPRHRLRWSKGLAVLIHPIACAAHIGIHSKLFRQITKGSFEVTTLDLLVEFNYIPVRTAGMASPKFSIRVVLQRPGFMPPSPASAERADVH